MNAVNFNSGGAGMAQPNSSARMVGKVGAGVIALALLAACGPATFGSTVTWQSAADVSGNSDVSTLGTLVSAYTLGATSSNITINSVLFTAVNTPTSSSGPSSVALGSDTITSDSIAGGNFYGAPSSFSAAYQSLLNAAFFESNNNTADPLVLTLNGLTPGQTYQFETWVNDARTGSGVGGRTETVGAPNDVATLAYQTGALGAGQFVLGTFTADSTGSQVMTYTGNADAQINAFQLRAVPVPEPASLGLVAAGGLGLLLIGKRRKVV